LRTLTEPTDWPEFEEQTIIDIEKDVDELAEKLQKLSDEEEQQVLGLDCAKLDRVEQETARKREIAERKRSVFEQQIRFRERRRTEFEQKLERQKEAIADMKSKNDEAELARSKSDVEGSEKAEKEVMSAAECTEKLAQLEQARQQKLDRVTAEIDQKEGLHHAERERDEERWQRKMQRIDKYMKRKTKKDALVMKNSELSEAKDELAEKAKSTRSALEHLRRKRAQLVKFQSENQDANSVIGIWKSEMKEKEAIMDERRKAIAARRSEIADSSQKVDELETDYETLRKRVLALEAQVAEYQGPLENMADQIREESSFF
jgi:chromosome segregation ATPase